MTAQDARPVDVRTVSPVGVVAGGALERARRQAYGPGEFVDQQGFMLASEILDLAVRAGVGPGTSVLDLCCGPGGPGLLLTQELGCDYLGVDGSAEAVATARLGAAGSGARFARVRVPPVPPGPFDVVLLLETLLAFRDKETLLRQVRDALHVGGRFACTVEVGSPLTPDERAVMPAPDTVWPVPLPELLDLLQRVGLEVTWSQERTGSHLAVAESLLGFLAAHGPDVAAEVGRDVLAEMLTAHQLWAEWLRSGRVRKVALVARRTPAP